MASRNDTPEQKAAHAAYMKAYRDKNHERMIIMERARYHKNQDRWRRENRNYVNGRRRELYRDNAPAEISRQQSSYRKLRNALIAAYGGVCKCCGESEVMFLEIDHINGGGAKHLRSKPPATIYREMLENYQPTEYQVLCSNCNRGRQRNGGVCPHQTNKVTQVA